MSAPLGDYVGNEAGWLGAAWPVSAVLLGFVIALVVFLLQAVGGRSLRAERTFQAVIAESAIAWPIAFSLVFLGWVAVVERYAGESHAPGWVTTWSLGLFITQLLTLLLVFGRIRPLLAPAGVARTLERALKHDIDRSVEERLTRQRAIELLNDAFAAGGFSARSPFDGYTVPLGLGGYVDDIDLELPSRLASYGVAEEISVWWLVLGDKVNAAAAIATLCVRPSKIAERLYRASVRVRRNPRVREDWIELFQDVIDLGLRALAEGTVRDLAIATDVIVAGLTEVPRVYSLFGREYDAAAVRQIRWRPSEEDRMLELLERMSADVAGSQKTDALAHFVTLPFQLADVALRDNVALLLEQAIALWLSQARHARMIGPQAMLNAVIDRIHRLSSAIADSLVRRFEEGQLSVAERQQAANYLRRINWFRGQLLKSYVDADDVSAFRGLLSDMTARSNSRNPIHDADALRAQLGRAADANSRARLSRALTETERIAQAFREILEDRAWDWFRVGAWAAWQHRHERIRDDTWSYVSKALAQPFQPDGMAGQLEGLVSSRVKVHELDAWDRASQDVRASMDVWTPRDTEIAMFWAALILLRETNPASPPTLPPEASMLYFDQVDAQLKYIEGDASRWTSVTGADVQSKAAALRTAAATAKDAFHEQRMELIAAAPLSQQRIDRCRELAWHTFIEGNPLRTRLQEAGALELEEDEDAFSPPRAGGPLAKEAFTDQSHFGIDADARSLGRRAAARQQGWLYRELVNVGQVVEVRDTVASAISDAIADLRDSGHTPDVVILPNRFLPDGLTDDPGFTWASVNMQELGRLGDAMVLGVAAQNAEFVVVCDLSHAVLVRERARPGDTVPMVLDVKPINAERAAEMLDSGLAKVNSKQTRDQAIAELQSLRVDVLADLDYYVSGVHVDRAVRLISIRGLHV